MAPRVAHLKIIGVVIFSDIRARPAGRSRCGRRSHESALVPQVECFQRAIVTAHCRRRRTRGKPDWRNLAHARSAHGVTPLFVSNVGGLR